jgi:hypothetical protein
MDMTPHSEDELRCEVAQWKEAQLREIGKQ